MSEMSFEQMLDESFKTIHNGEVVEGTVIDVKDDEIILKTSESGSWFILRTHGEEIEEIEGGTQKKLEDNVYLIQAQDTTVKIQVKTAGLHYSK